MKGKAIFYNVSLCAILLATLIALVTPPLTGGALAQGIDEPKYALRQTDGKDTDEAVAYYVRYKEGYKRAALAALNAVDVQITHELDVINTVAVVVSKAMLASIQSDPNVEFVEPVPQHQLMAQVVPWNIDMVQARDVWDVNRDGDGDPGAPDGSGVKLCIIDSGFYAAHDDFQASPPPARRKSPARTGGRMVSAMAPTSPVSPTR